MLEGILQLRFGFLGAGSFFRPSERARRSSAEERGGGVVRDGEGTSRRLAMCFGARGGRVRRASVHLLNVLLLVANFPRLVFKGIYHYWKYALFFVLFQGT